MALPPAKMSAIVSKTVLALAPWAVRQQIGMILLVVMILKEPIQVQFLLLSLPILPTAMP